MEPIVNLLYTEAARNLTHRFTPLVGERINISNVINEVLKPAYDKYCAQMSGTKCHLGCPNRITLLFNQSLYQLDLELFQYNERVVYLTKDLQKTERLYMYFSEGKCILYTLDHYYNLIFDHL